MENSEATSLPDFLELKQKLDDFTQTFWRLGVKLLHQDPACELSTYFTEYFPSKEDIMKEFDIKKKELKKRLTRQKIMDEIREYWEDDIKNYQKILDCFTDISGMMTNKCNLCPKPESDVLETEEKLKNSENEVPEMITSSNEQNFQENFSLNFGDKIEILIRKSSIDVVSGKSSNF